MDLKRLVKRSNKVAFIQSEDGEKYYRMKGFKDLGTNREPKEYTRRYVDMDEEVTDVTGINTSMDFAFDQYEGEESQKGIIKIIEDELVSDEAKVSIVQVDFTEEVDDGYKAMERIFTVVPSEAGDTLDAYTYSGSLKAAGEKVDGVATSTDNFKKTATFKKTEDKPETRVKNISTK